nr:hypothetical protein [candidate division Zixibacteria bacterium]
MSKKIDSDKRNKNTDPFESQGLKREPVSEQSDEVVNPFGENECLDKDKMFIECPGATVYDPETREIIAGVQFLDENDPSAGYRIINHPVYAPEHRSKRLIKKDHFNSIRRCQACQDLTVRLVRREGPDFFIPNPKFPHKKQLKSVEKNW